MRDIFELYTGRAKRTIELAEDEAVKLGSSEIGTEHILLGLVRDAALVSSLRVSSWVPELRDEVVAYLPRQEKESRREDLALSTMSKRALVLARKEARESSDLYLCTYHILLGLLQIEDCLAAKVLRRNGLSSGYVRERMLACRDEESKQQTPTQGTDGTSPSPIDPAIEYLWLLAIELSMLDDYEGVFTLVDDAVADQKCDRNQTVKRLIPIAAAVARTTASLEKAQGYYEHWVASDPDNALPLFGLACCLKGQRKTEEAINVARRVQRLSLAQDGEIGKGLAEMVKKQFPEVSSDT